MPLNKDEILNSNDRKIESLNVPEWGGDVCIRTLKGSERDAWEASLKVKDGGPTNLVNARARLAALVLCDEHGIRLFSDNEVGSLGEKSAKALTRVWEAALALNGIGDEAVKELEKNSGMTLGGDSSSD